MAQWAEKPYWYFCGETFCRTVCRSTIVDNRLVQPDQRENALSPLVSSAIHSGEGKSSIVAAELHRHVFRMADPLDPGALRRRIERSTVVGVQPETRDRGRTLLLAWFDAAVRHGIGSRQIARALRDGLASLQIADARRAEVMADPPREVREAACTAGCAFCCVLTDEDGGTITAVEAMAIYDALAPFREQPDGRTWMPLACPALDPETRLCRIYQSRPSICRSYYSTDVRSCEINAKGGKAEGSGALRAHVDYLLVLALSRASLRGIAQVPSFSLRDVAAAALSGRSVNDGQHPPRILDKMFRGRSPRR